MEDADTIGTKLTFGTEGLIVVPDADLAAITGNGAVGDFFEASWYQPKPSRDGTYTASTPRYNAGELVNGY